MNGNQKSHRVAVVEGVRTPFCKANGVFKNIKADDLSAITIRELLERTKVEKKDIDHVIIGNVVQDPNTTNMARIAAIKGGIPVETPAFTVNRNCASGLEAVVSGVNQILNGNSKIVLAGGVESMSHFPVSFPDKMREFLLALNKSKTFGQKLKVMLTFRPSMLKPQIPEIKDPICGLVMGQTAEIISRDLKVSREEQDEFAFISQKRASDAIKSGRFNEEIVPVPLPPKYEKLQTVDDGPRENQTMEALSKLRPVFDKLTGQVTAGNSSQVTDGAAVLLLMDENEAKKRGIPILGYINASVSVGLDPARMGLGPVYAVAKLLKQENLKLDQIDLLEINEAFAAQIVALEKAFQSPDFAKNKLGLDEPIGKIDRERLNVNGGAVALGHPVGASGTRLVLTLLKELKRRGKRYGIATLCIGGGQGEAVLVEAAQ